MIITSIILTSTLFGAIYYKLKNDQPSSDDDSNVVREQINSHAKTNDEQTYKATLEELKSKFSSENNQSLLRPVEHFESILKLTEIEKQTMQSYIKKQIENKFKEDIDNEFSDFIITESSEFE